MSDHVVVFIWHLIHLQIPFSSFILKIEKEFPNTQFLEGSEERLDILESILIHDLKSSQWVSKWRLF